MNLKRLACARMVVLVALALSCPALLSAARPMLSDEPGTSAWPPPTRLIREPDPLTVRTNESVQSSLRAAHKGVRDFLAGQPAWKVQVDPRTGGIEKAFGEGLSVQGLEAGGSRESIGRRFLSAHRSLLPADLDLSREALTFDDRKTVQLPDPETRVVRFELRKDSLPVLGAGVSMALRGEKIFFVSTSALAPVTTSSIPKLDPQSALQSVTRYVGDSQLQLRLVKSASLAFYPTLEGPASTLRHHLVWVIETRPENARPWEGFIAYVDAHDGEVLAFFPEARNDAPCNADPAQGRARVMGGVRANRADDVEKSLLLPFVRMNVGGTFVSSNLNGRFPYTGGTVSSTLEGDFFRAHCDQCTNPVQPTASGGESGDVDFGLGGSSSPTPVPGNGRSTPADRSAYFQLNQARLLLSKWNNAFFGDIDAYVNINASCNAFSSSYLLGFYRAGGNCNDTGEIRDVVQHELGHTWDRTDSTTITNGALSEWKGDVLAVLMGGDPCIGESFFISGGPTSTCSGVRDVDERAVGRVDHTLTPAECPTCATLTASANDCGGEGHCVGEISGQALWHLLYNLRTGTDYITGAALPAGNSGMSDEQARWILERLMIGGGASMVTWDPASAGLSEYNAVTVADDDDGNLANGTPHAAYINAAFAHHGLTETTLVADSAECAPLSDPIAIAVEEREAASALPRVRLEWTPVGGATTFDVYRNTRAGDAFLPIAQNVSAGPIFDVGVQEGITYRYFVAAVRKTGCAAISPGASILSVSVQPPLLRVSAKTVSESGAGADGDGRIEPGERIQILVKLEEKGGFAGATGVTATLSSASPTFAPMVSSGPVSFGSIAPGGTATAAAPFEVFLGPTIACGATVHFVLSVSANEGCWLDEFDVELTKTANGCTVTPSAFVEIVPGSPAVTSGSGDGDGIADNCETTTVGYQVRNSGSAASGAVLATASTTNPGVTFVPSPSCALGNLDPGQVSPCQFSFSLGGASSAGVPFTLLASSAGNAAPSRLDFTLPAETNPPTFSTVTYNFDTNLFQGWTVQKFGLSVVHPFSGARSLHAGSTTVANICAHATSPALLLHPTLASTLSLQIWGDVEPLSDAWYDRANVHLVDLDTNQHVLLVPTGFTYNASGNSEGLCHMPGQNGWAGSFTSWHLASFDLTPYRGHRIQVEVNYSTDEGDNRDGIYIDDVTLTNATSATLPADAQGDGCGVPEVSADGAVVPVRIASPAPGQVRFSWQDLGPAFQYSLYAGSIGTYYSHGASQVLCQGRGLGMTCDGTSCTLDLALGSLPAGNLYFVVTAAAYGNEGSAGFATGGIERDPAQNSCAP